MSAAPRSSSSHPAAPRAGRVRRVGRQHFIAVVATIAATSLLAACADSDNTSSSGTSGSVPATPSPGETTAAPPPATAVADTSPAAADPTSFGALLATAPAPVIREGDGGLVSVMYGNLDVVGALIGAPRPDGTDPDTVIEWAIAMSTDRSDDGAQAAVALMPQLVTQGSADPAEMTAELGWQVGDVAAFLEVSAGSENVTLVTGDITEAGLAAAGTADGDTWRVGEGDDFSSNVDEVTPVRRLGQPLQLAWRDGVALVSRSTAAAEGFATGSSSLLEAEPRFAAVAAPLVARDVHGALMATIPVGDPLYDAYAVGQTVVDGERIALFVYHAPDAAGTAALEAAVRESLATDGPSFADAAWAELFPNAEVVVEDQTVVATMPLAPTTSAQLAWRVIMMGDGPTAPTA